MKKVLFLFVLGLSFNAVASDISVNVSGMVCSMCAQGIQKKLTPETSIREVRVNMDEKVVKIQTHEGKDISDETIKKLIQEAGNNVASIERK